MEIPAPGMQVVALFDFKGQTKEDLPFKKGECFTIERISEDPNWWSVTNAKGQKGMIPANYVDVRQSAPREDSTLPRDASGQLIGPMPWFHGKIPRDEATKMLQSPKVIDGQYLVRESTSFPGDYTLCVRSTPDQIDHYHIKGARGRIFVDEDSDFKSLNELIEHYHKEADGLAHVLTKPLVRKDGKELTRQAIAEYEIEPRDLIKGTILGSGQFGEVFLGTYKGKQVAIKELKNLTSSAKDEFLAEASVMTKLKDSNLVCLIGVVTLHGNLRLVTEFMEKGNLLDYLRSRGRSVVTQKMQLGFTRDICSGMAFLEKRGVVHRDLAARNVLVSGEDIAKVADFGLARRSTDGAVDLGKLPIKWTAPEVLRQKVSTSKSDVWSFGVTMWEIYSFGRSPYPRMSQKEVVDKVVAEGYRMEIPDNCPDAMYKMMLSCWSLTPLERPTFNRLKKELKPMKAK
eukprot:m.15374 g.15374  ORF g.15374 m.15374 type:complete len:458 (-) comp4463_c0_seq2:950-2323(-)